MTRSEIITPRSKSLASLADPSWAEPALLSRSIKGPRLFGLAVTGAFVAIFGLWGGLVPLAGGAMAPGVIVPESSRKTVQHLEGGIVHEIKVREGDEVQVGQPLVVLDDAQALANHELHRARFNALLARHARLQAEAKRERSLVVPAELALAGEEANVLVDAQRHVLVSRLDALDARRRVLGEKRLQLSEQIKGHTAQIAGLEKQIELVRQESGAKSYLLSKGYLAKPEALRLDRAEADLDARRGELTAAISRAQHQIGEVEVELVSIVAEHASRVAGETETTTAELKEARQKLDATGDVLRRTVVRATVSGVVTNVRVKSSGTVLQRGEPILDLVPRQDKLVIEARVSPLDIDIVRIGLPAQIHLSSYTGSLTPRISGVVISVAADSVTDPGTRAPHFVTKVEVNASELATLAPHMKLMPGMPADVMIVTEQRTMLDYLWQPISDAMRRSFRQSS